MQEVHSGRLRGAPMGSLRTPCRLKPNASRARLRVHVASRARCGYEQGHPTRIHSSCTPAHMWNAQNWETREF